MVQPPPTPHHPPPPKKIEKEEHLFTTYLLKHFGLVADGKIVFFVVHFCLHTDVTLVKTKYNEFHRRNPYIRLDMGFYSNMAAFSVMVSDFFIL